MPSWVEAGSLLVAALSLAVTALNLWRNRRELTATYRAKLFERQLEACEEVIAVLDERHRRLTLVLALREFTHAEAGHQEQLWSEVRTLFSNNPKWADAQARNIVFLPNDVILAIERYDTAATRILADRYTGRGGPRTGEIAPSERISDAYGEIVAAIRSAIGTDVLTKQTHLIMGVAPDEAVESARRRLVEAEDLVRRRGL